MPKYQAYPSMDQFIYPSVLRLVNIAVTTRGIKGSVMKSIGECITNNFQYRDNELTEKIRDEVI